ncbi:MAG: hypothetical protein ABII06_16675 [Pseudomonadota bacterium]
MIDDYVERAFVPDTLTKEIPYNQNVMARVHMSDFLEFVSFKTSVSRFGTSFPFSMK